MEAPTAAWPSVSRSHVDNRRPSRRGHAVLDSFSLLGDRPKRRRTFGLVVAVAFGAAFTAAAASGTYVVDGSHPACSDSGPGTLSTPYCRILAALQAQGGPGTTILVKPGIYREQVTVPASGASGDPLVIQALGSPTLIDGADDLSSPDLWVPYSGTVYLAGSVTWTPQQVLVQGVALTLATGWPPQSIPQGMFLPVAGEGLYVNVGVNPGSLPTFVGRRSNGFRLNGRSWVTIQGFQVTRTEDNGIYALNGASHIVISQNTISFANFGGIETNASSLITIEGNVVSKSNNHGIYLRNGSADSTVQDNESFMNVRRNGVGANGIEVEGSARILVQRNLLHDNQDTGLQISVSDDTVGLQNRSWDNGDHGFDHIGSHRTIHVGEVAWGNFRDGFSVEGSNIDTGIYNSISTNNGLSTGRFNLYVDTTSTTGFASNHNIFWNSQGQSPIKFNGTIHATIAGFTAATGRDVHSLQLNPLFEDPGGGDFRLQAGSPAIDSADSSVPSWPSIDADGTPRADDPDVPNTGTGSIPFADRGALERACAAAAPVGSSALDALSMPGATQIQWTTLPVADAYDVVRGGLAASVPRIDFQESICLAPKTTSTSVLDSNMPSIGTGYWYLVRGVNCGGPGTYNSGAASQVGDRDAAIALSPLTCP